MTRRFAAIIVVAVLVFLVDVFAGPFFFFSTRTWAPEMRDGKLIGSIEGAIKRTDARTDTVRMPAGFLGLASLPLVVTLQTRIAVTGKLGGFGDLEPGQMVRIAYEVLPDRLLARRIDVLDGRGSDSALLSASESDDELPSSSASVVTSEPSSSAATAPPSPAPVVARSPAVPPAPSASLSAARQHEVAASVTKRIAPPRVATRSRVAKPRRPETARKAPPSTASAPATRKDPSRGP